MWSPAVRVLAVCVLSPQQPQEEFQAARLTAHVVLGVHGKEDFERYKMKRLWGWLLFYENLNLLNPKSSQVGVIGHFIFLVLYPGCLPSFLWNCNEFYYFFILKP